MASIHGASEGDRPDDPADEVSDADLASAMKDVPKGALALVGLSLAIVMLLWLILYFGVFIPRGPVN